MQYFMLQYIFMFEQKSHSVKDESDVYMSLNLCIS